MDNTSSHFGGQGYPAEYLAKECNAIFVNGIGARAIQLSNSLGLGVFVGAEGTVKDVIERFKQGKLRQATETDGCQH